MIRYGRPAFYDAKAPQGQWAQWSQTEQPGAKSICWLCSVDGQILASAGNDWADGAESEANPLDYILLAKEIIQLAAKGGAKLVRLLRAGKPRSTMAGATVKAANTAASTGSAALAAQTGWKNLGKLSAKEQELIEQVVKSQTVVVGRTGGNRTGTVYAALSTEGKTATVLDEWLAANGFKWSQRWQDVFNRALYERAKGGLPVSIISGGGFTAGEGAAAEAGAAAANPRITNIPYWPDTK